MVRAVFDTNILVSATFWNGNPRQAVVKAAQGKVNAFISRAILTEFAHVLARDFGLERDFIRLVLKNYLRALKPLKPQEKISVVELDPADNRVLECAVAGNADYLVTGDKELLALKKFRQTRIVSAKEFLDLV